MSSAGFCILSLNFISQIVARIINFFVKIRIIYRVPTEGNLTGISQERERMCVEDRRGRVKKVGRSPR